MLPKFDSDKLKFWSFVSMVLLVFVHGYNIDSRYMAPWTTPNEPLTATTFIEYFVANGLLRFRIPMLFAISGFLYALHDQKPNRERIGKRFRTLLLPYFLWSILYVVLFCIAEQIPPFAKEIASSRIAQIDPAGKTLLVHEYPWWGFLVRALVVPLPYQLWFIRVLFFYNLAYPLLSRWVQGPISQIVFFPVVSICWLLTSSLFLIEAEGLLFFSLGILFHKTNFDLHRPPRGLHPRAWGAVFLSLATLKTWLAFSGQAFLGEAVYPTLAALHKLVILSGLITAWYGSDRLVTWCMAKPWFLWLTGFSFIIYAAHAPLVAILIDPSLALLDGLPAHRLLGFVLLPLAVIAFCIALGACLRRLLPRAYGLLTGGRGL